MEIKRYGLGAKAEKITDDSAQLGLVGIVERPDGEYHKVSDVDAILESIGAGGVSGRITGKKLEEHREEFEEWCDKEGYDTYRHLDINHEPVGVYKYETTHELWQAWKAARGITG